jgi:hypothetical protein
MKLAASVLALTTFLRLSFTIAGSRPLARALSSSSSDAGKEWRWIRTACGMGDRLASAKRRRPQIQGLSPDLE